jgi:hypothetical protein
MTWSADPLIDTNFHTVNGTEVYTACQDVTNGTKRYPYTVSLLAHEEGVGMGLRVSSVQLDRITITPAHTALVTHFSLPLCF